MSDTDQNNAKKESVQLLGLWAVTMVVTIMFISSLSTRTSEPIKEPAEAEHAQVTEAVAPPLDSAQTMAPLPAGHPSIEQFQAEVAPAPPAMPELPAGHPPLDVAPAPVSAVAPTPAVASMHAPVEHAKADSHDQHEVHWGYEGNGAPWAWGMMKQEYLACSLGSQQSPINIDPESAVTTKLGGINFDYQPSPLEVLNNGHTVQVNFAPGSSIQFKGKTFELLQLHFHSPSEHQIDYRYFDMEVHLVHKSVDGELAVIGVMLQQGTGNPVINAIWEHFPQEVNQPKTIVGAMVNAADLLPTDTSSFYHYMGSLTTPPCSETVNWIVMQNSLTLKRDQVTMFTDAMGENNRPVQKINGRHLLTNAQ